MFMFCTKCFKKNSIYNLILNQKLFTGMLLVLVIQLLIELLMASLMMFTLMVMLIQIPVLRL
jgi:hypothetical protein